MVAAAQLQGSRERPNRRALTHRTSLHDVRCGSAARTQVCYGRAVGGGCTRLDARCSR
jgi:hypothetical protein